MSEPMERLPAVAEAYLEQVVAQMAGPRYMKDDVRRELTAHMEDCFQYCGSAEAREAEALACIEEFGDPALLAELIRRGKKRCTRGALSGLIGLGMMGTAVVIYIVLGATLGIFVNIPGFMVAVGVPIALGAATYGPNALLRSSLGIAALCINLDPVKLSESTPVVLRRMAEYTYASCGIGMLIGFIVAFSQLNDPSQMGPPIAVIILVPLYGVLLAECCYRPAAGRVAFLLSLDTRHYGKKPIEQSTPEYPS